MRYLWLLLVPTFVWAQSPVVAHRVEGKQLVWDHPEGAAQLTSYLVTCGTLTPVAVAKTVTTYPLPPLDPGTCCTVHAIYTSDPAQVCLEPETVNLLPGGDMETFTGTTGSFGGTSPTVGLTPEARSGQGALRIAGPGYGWWLSNRVPVPTAPTVRITLWWMTTSGKLSAWALWRDANGQQVHISAIASTSAVPTWTQVNAELGIPVGATTLQVQLRAEGTATMRATFDDLAVTAP